MRVVRSVALVLGLVGGLPGMALADDIYTGPETVVSTGETPQTCVSRNMLISVNGQSFAVGKPSVATGTVGADGSINATYTTGTGARVAEFKLSGRIDGGKATGTITGSTGCVLGFALTKH